MTPISAPSSSRSAGFTLIEMLVVLTVLALLAIIVGGGIGQRPGMIARQEATLRLRAAIADAKEQAGRTGQASVVDPGSMISDGEYRAGLPTPEKYAGLILVHPDGSSSGGAITVDGVPVLKIDWLTSEVRHAS